jgi:hypothetical protein
MMIELTNLVQNKNELLALALPSPHLFLYQSTPTSFWIPRIKDKNDDITLIDDFVQRPDVVSPHLFFRLLLCPRRIHGGL